MTDKIDRIVEKEIPEVLDETTPLEENINQPAAESNGINLIGSNGSNSPRYGATQRSSANTNKKKADSSLAEDINYILDDDLPAAESSGINLIGSNGLNSPRSIATPPSSSKTNKKKADNSLAEDIDYILNDNMPPAESNGPCFPSSNVIPSSSATQNAAKKEDNNPKRDIQNIVSDGKPDAKSKGTSLSIAPGLAPGPKAIYAKRKNRKMDNKEQVLEVVLGCL